MTPPRTHDTMKTRLVFLVLYIVAAIQTVSANSTGRFVEPNRGLDYFWVPGNQLLFHIDYPYDFILYALAIIGLAWVVYTVGKFVWKRWLS